MADAGLPSAALADSLWDGLAALAHQLAARHPTVQPALQAALQHSLRARATLSAHQAAARATPRRYASTTRDVLAFGARLVADAPADAVELVLTWLSSAEREVLDRCAAAPRRPGSA